MSSPAVHGVDASPYSHAARSGILTPSSEGSINRHDGVSASSSQPHRAIRTSSLAMDHLLKPPIMVKVSRLSSVEDDIKQGTDT